MPFSIRPDFHRINCANQEVLIFTWSILLLPEHPVEKLFNLPWRTVGTDQWKWKDGIAAT